MTLPSSLPFESGHLDDEHATLDGVDNDVATGQASVVTPGADEVHDTAFGQMVVLGIDLRIALVSSRNEGGTLGHKGAYIKPTNFFNASAGWVVWNAGNVKDC